MRETIEFRIPEEYAARYLRPGDGTTLGGSVRKYVLDRSDPRMKLIGEVDERLKRRKHVFFTAWIPQRTYTKRELDNAELLQLMIKKFFEPAGEECGTQYDEKTACRICGAGAQQVSDLRLSLKRIPRKDISKTIAGEIVVSAKIVKLFKSHRISGAAYGPVWHTQSADAPSKEWYQLKVMAALAEIVPPTVIGKNPFDLDPAGQYRCSQGDLAGLNLISEVWVSTSSISHGDIFSTKQFVGVRRGLLRPERVLLVSSKVYKLLKLHKVSGIDFEIAHCV